MSYIQHWVKSNAFHMILFKYYSDFRCYKKMTNKFRSNIERWYQKVLLQPTVKPPNFFVGGKGVEGELIVVAVPQDKWLLLTGISLRMFFKSKFE